MVCKGKLYSGPFTALTVEIKVGTCVTLKELMRKMRLWNNFQTEKVKAKNYC